MDWVDAVNKLAVPGAIGGAIVVAASWGIGRFNNALAITLTAQRQRIDASTENPRVAEDDVALELCLTKAAYTRVRLMKCVADVTIFDAAGKEARGYGKPERAQTVAVAPTPPERAQELASALTKSLTDDFKTETDGMALVAGDSVKFQAYFRLPRGAAAHIKLVIEGSQLLFESVGASKPTWSSSVVVLPTASLVGS